jgi:hypothetical protein
VLHPWWPFPQHSLFFLMHPEISGVGDL